MTSTIRAYLDKSATSYATVNSAADGTFSLPLANVPAGTHTVEVTAQGMGELESPRSILQNITVQRAVITPPVVITTPGVWTNISPAVNYTFLALVNYGMQALDGAKADAPKTLYVGTCGYGIFKSTDGGDNWIHISTGRNGAKLGNGINGSARNWALKVDPINSNVVYTVAGFGQGIGGGGFWRSLNGGVDWDQMLDSSTLAVATDDITNIDIDPNNHLHILCASHSPRPGLTGVLAGASGLLESLDGGTTWRTIAPTVNWGVAPAVLFLGKDDAGNPSGSTWILGSGQGATTLGTWRTTDSGSSWTMVYPQSRSHAGLGLYRAKTGVLYLGLDNRVVRSLDNGKTWTDAGDPGSPDAFGGLIGDGTNIWSMLANTGVSTSGPYHWQISPETDGTHWTVYNSQIFQNGPSSMIYDPVNKVLYSSQWATGVWRLQLA